MTVLKPSAATGLILITAVSDVLLLITGVPTIVMPGPKSTTVTPGVQFVNTPLTVTFSPLVPRIPDAGLTEVMEGMPPVTTNAPTSLSTSPAVEI